VFEASETLAKRHFLLLSCVPPQYPKESPMSLKDLKNAVKASVLAPPVKDLSLFRGC
jgi:hypothetical protein